MSDPAAVLAQLFGDDAILPVLWLGGPHDGEQQGVYKWMSSDLPTARVCACHDEIYVVESFDATNGYVLRHAEQWNAKTAEYAAKHAFSFPRGEAA